MTKELRQKVLDKYNCKCGYCGCDIDIKTMQVDHMKSKVYFMYNHFNEDVNDYENLMPSCKECNHYKRSHNLESDNSHIGFRDYMLKFHVRLSKLPKNTLRMQTVRRIEYMQKISDKYGITPTIPFTGTFYFETL